MALKVSKPGKLTEYVLQVDRESEVKTVFDLRPLTQEEIGQFNALTPLTPEQSMRMAVVITPSIIEGRQLNDDELAQIQKIMPGASDAEHTNRVFKQYAYAVRRGLTGIRGLLDENGKPQTMDAATFTEYADWASVIELGIEILRISQLDRVQIKK